MVTGHHDIGGADDLRGSEPGMDGLAVRRVRRLSLRGFRRALPVSLSLDQH